MKQQTNDLPGGTEAVVHLKTPLGALRALWEASAATPEIGTGPKLADSGLGASPKDGILKCLNIKYADIPYRWAAPRKVTSPWSGTRDRTEFGPGCPQIGHPLFGVGGVPMFGQLGRDASGGDTMTIRPEREDEFACLNLNIYTPAAQDIASKADGIVFPPTALRPVLVWVHGGSYQVGSGSVDAYDGTNLVRRGLEISSPVVVVTINYRLGVLGFLHSRELAESAATQLDVPPAYRSTANLGLLDCKSAFEWIKEHIQHFGGDPENITAIGESAGASAIHYMMLVPQLNIHISRIILSSSTCMSIQLLRASEAQSSFDAICRKFGVTSGESAVEELRSVHIRKLVEETWFMSSTYRPIWDDITITADPREAAFQPALWDSSLQSVVLGTCHNEPWIREAAMIANNKTHDISRVIQSRIPPDDALRRRAAQLYADAHVFPWHKTTQEPDASAHHRSRSMAFDGHCRYNTPAALFSRSFVSSSSSFKSRPCTVYRYVFGYPTAHWPESWPVTHTADILPMFLHSSLAGKDRKVAETFADRLLQFTAGSVETEKGAFSQESQLSPWVPYTADTAQLNVLGADGNWSVAGETEGAFDLTEEHVQFWAAVVKAIITTGREGWAGMTR